MRVPRLSGFRTLKPAESSRFWLSGLQLGAGPRALKLVLKKVLRALSLGRPSALRLRGVRFLEQ